MLNVQLNSFFHYYTNVDSGSREMRKERKEGRKEVGRAGGAGRRVEWRITKIRKWRMGQKISKQSPPLSEMIE